jgi:amino acid adenylation domain-containing protein
MAVEKAAETDELQTGQQSQAEEHIYVFPMTFAQQRLFFLYQLDPKSTSYNIPWSIRITGQPDVKALETALNEIVRRHEILRTTFDVVEGHPVQVIAPGKSIPLVQVDLSRSANPEQEAQQAAMQESRTPFDLRRGPIVRTTLLQLGPTDYVLLITTHHIAFDGWSRRVLVSELQALYRAFSSGEGSTLPELPLQYADYAVWQRKNIDGEKLESLLSYWRQQLEGAPTTLDLPTDRPRPAVQSFRGAGKQFSIPKALADEVQKASRQFGTTSFMTLLTAFYLLLARHSGEEDIVIGGIIANRNRAEVEGLIGLFANTLPLRTKLSGDPSFRQLLERVRDTALGAYAHQDMPFDRLVEELRPERSPSYNPLFQVLFSLQGAASRTFELSGLQLQPLSGVVGTTAKFDLSFFLLEGPDSLGGRIEYNTDLFDSQTIERMLQHYLKLLENGLAYPDRPMSKLDLLEDAERKQVLVDFNQTAAEFPVDICLHDFVAKQAEETPKAVAVVSGDERLTYAELNTRANRLANFLVKKGAGPDVLIGINCERKAHLLVAILGVLKSGCAYVPLDPMYPKDRIQAILEDSKAPLVLTQRTLADDLPAIAGEKIVIDEVWPTIEREPATQPKSGVAPNNLAYVLFTSGSTGRPKGVAIEHHSAATFVHWAQTVFTPQELAGVLFSTSVCFDLSVFEMFVPLSVGGKVITVENALYLPSFAFRDEVTLINTVPSAMQELLRMRGVPASVTTVNLAGEALPDVLVDQIYAETKVQRVYNLYGPTEDTTYSTFTLVQRGTSVTIGSPIANSQAYILNGNLEPVPIGVPGELYLAGDGLARGYYGRPDLTRERFVPNPFSELENARMYRTGDLARWRPDGDIDYLGRIDHQVKLRGFRIELGEIETLLLEEGSIERAVVVVREDRPGNKLLAAYFVPKSGGSVDLAELKAYLDKHLPGYMVPAAFVEMAALPVTDNGKINRRALPAPDWTRIETTEKTEPKDELERSLVRVWEKVLGVSDIGTTDDFFDLGGHSLLAVRLLSEVEKVAGRQVPLASLFRASTVAAQAQLLRQGLESEPEPLVLEYQPGRKGNAAFFAVAAPGVRSLGYALLARQLGETQPFYKLQASAPIVQGRPLNMGELRALAQQYVAGMRAVQSEGPYYIVAMCGGCQIAEQMILQLEALGQKVGMFAIFDTWVLEHAHRRWGWRVFGVQQRMRWLRRVSLGEGLMWVGQAASARFQIWSGKQKPNRPWAEAYWPQDFQAPRFKAPVILFKRPKQPYYYVADPLLGWGSRSEGGVTTFEIKANHHEVLRDPHVQFVSRVLLEQIHKLNGTPSAASQPAPQVVAAS